MAKIDGAKRVSGDISAELDAAGEGEGKFSFFRGVVEQILFDADTLPLALAAGESGEDDDKAEEVTEELRELFKRLENPKIAIDLPDNTLLVRTISNGEYKNGGKLKICFPMFPSHIMMPIKVGEQVFFFTEGDLGYWLSRAPGTQSVDDVNYSHNDRRLLNATGEDSTVEQSKSAEGSDEKKIGIFNNGGAAEDKISLPEDDSYDKLFDELSLTNNSVTYEPIPKFIKRPGDLVLQGSNNTLICLGQNRAWKKEDELTEEEITSNAHYEEAIPESGTIDLVAGRGRFLPDSETTTSADGSDPYRTSCRTIANERETIEADRAPILNQILRNPVEGDPDFGYDASRILVTMKSNTDTDFTILGTEGDGLPSVPAVATEGDGEVPEAIEEAAYVAIKSDEIRFIARRQEESEIKDGTPEINGSIKIIKEGVQDSEEGDGRAVIMMMPDGTIMIDGPTVIIGSGAEGLAKDNGAGTHVILGRGATEPLIYGTVMKDLLDTFMNDIKAHLDNLKSHLSSGFDAHTHPTGVGPSGPPLVPSAAFQGQIDGTKSAIDASIDNLINTLSTYGKIK